MYAVRRVILCEKREIIPLHRRKGRYSRITDNQVSPNSSSVVAGPTTALQQQKLAEALQQLNASHNTYEQHVSRIELRPEQGRRGPKWGSRPTPAADVSSKYF